MSKFSTISVQELRLVDEHGRLRALLGTWPESGLPYLTFLDAEQRPRATVGFDDNGKVHVSLQRENGSTTIGIGEWPDGTVFVGVYGTRGNPLVEVAVGTDENIHTVGLDNLRK